jgi:hypothetical protein
MQTLTKINLKKLYELDYLAWYETTLNQIKNNQLNELDFDNLSEVLENLVKDIKRSGESYLKQIIINLLLIEYWETETINHRHWASEIDNFRDELDNDMTTNLRKHLANEKEKIYQKSVRNVILKTGLNQKTFPVKCPYTLEQLLDNNWWPNKLNF